jgi:hypothetical protein
MSIALNLTKLVIKWTPRKLISWVANIVLKDIAELTRLRFDLESRTAYIQVQLVGESETIEVWVDGFAIIPNEDSYKFVIDKANSNRLWLDNILSRITGKTWKIPNTPQFAPQIAFIAELLKADSVPLLN